MSKELVLALKASTYLYLFGSEVLEVCIMIFFISSSMNILDIPKDDNNS
jgi:hypothetical protein